MFRMVNVCVDRREDHGVIRHSRRFGDKGHSRPPLYGFATETTDPIWQRTAAGEINPVVIAAMANHSPRVGHPPSTGTVNSNPVGRMHAATSLGWGMGER